MTGKGFQELTGAQRIQDEAFIKQTAEGLVSPFCERMEHEKPGYSRLNSVDRFELLRQDNLQFQGEGDSLPLELGDRQFNAYSGNPLAYKAWYGFNPSGAVELSQPLLRRSCDAVLGPDDEIPIRKLMNRGSRLPQYLYRDNAEKGNSSEPGSWNALPYLQELPVAYQAALICHYINENVIARPSDITEFVLGANPAIETLRYLATPQVNANERINGWTIRIRDVRPPLALGKHVASHLLKAVRNFEQHERDALQNVSGVAFDEERIEDESLLERKGKRVRGPNRSTEIMVAFIDEVKKTRSIGRNGDISWEDARIELNEKYGDQGCRYNSADSLRDSYRSFKDRHAQK